MKFAIDVPDTTIPDDSAGKSKSARIHRTTCRSTSTGAWSRPPRFASSPAASISATAPTAVPPPCTQPKNRGCLLPAVNGATCFANSAATASNGLPVRGNG